MGSLVFHRLLITLFEKRRNFATEKSDSRKVSKACG
jgi:hypothetical protein